MSLRLRVHLFLTALMVAFTALFLAVQINNTRQSVREEIEGAARVATQLLTRVGALEGQSGVAPMQAFLGLLGRVRANDIFLFDAAGVERYRSPPSTYKAGRDAPAWFAAWVSPTIATRDIALPDGRLLVRPEASRAVLDGWDDLTDLIGIALVGFVMANLIVYWLTGRALRPLDRISEALSAIEHGRLNARLPRLPSPEIDRIGRSFNTMAQAIGDGLAARAAEARARAELATQRTLTETIQQRIEAERGAIARELHDELGQQVTAIKTLGFSIAQRNRAGDPASLQAAELVVAAADRIHHSIHDLLHRLRPLALDQFGLDDALADLVDEWQLQYPAIAFRLANERQTRSALPERVATAAYRIVQEAVTNAIRHAGARTIAVRIAAREAVLEIVVSDDGCGIPLDWSGFERAGHFGLIGMRERAEALGGSLDVGRADGAGTRIGASLPIDPPAAAGPPAATDLPAATPAVAPSSGAVR